MEKSKTCVKVKIDEKLIEIEAGDYSESELKKVLEVPSEKVLAQIKDGILKEIRAGVTVHIGDCPEDGDKFISHEPVGSSS